MRANIGCSNRDHFESRPSNQEAGETHRWANSNVVEPTNAIGWGIRHLGSATGSGYQAAILSVLASEVHTIEIVPELGKMARANLELLGYSNVSTKIGNGYQGWAEHAPFDAIIVTAAPNHVPPPLIAQLRPGGRMVIPVAGFDQELLVFEKHADGTATSTTIAPVRFVPLIREQLCGSQCAALQHSALANRPSEPRTS